MTLLNLVGTDREVRTLVDQSADRFAKLVLLVARHAMDLGEAVPVDDDLGGDLGDEGESIVRCGPPVPGCPRGSTG
jgi:hypothetical protein